MSDFFNDMPEEATEEGEALVEQQMAEIEAQQDDEDVDYSQVLTDILTVEETETLGDAMMRLDQARLYEMLIKHNLFEGVRMNSRAIRIVQEEAKNFFMERLQILLGMKEEPKDVVISKDDQFNSMEVEALRDIAAKLTKGASQQQVDDQQIRPVTQPNRPQGLRPIQQKTGPKPPMRKPTPPQKRPIPTQSSEERIPLQKEPSKMTPSELLEFNKEVPRPKRGTGSRVLPMPDADQKQMLFARSSMANEGSAIAGLLQQHGKLGMVAIEQADSPNDNEVDGRL